jgi:Mg/Co/Ni transporter MgtE
MLDPLTKGYLTMRPDAAATTLLRLEEHDRSGLFEAMSPQLAAQVLKHMAAASASQCLASLDDETVSDILAQMSIPAAVAVLRQLPRKRVKLLLGRVPRTLAVRLRLGLRYAESVVGAFVDVNAVTFSPDYHVSDALRLYRREGQFTGYTIYVLTEQHHLAGQVYLNDLLSARERSIISRIMQPVPAVLSTRATLQSVARHPAWLTNDYLPVTNRNNIYQGVLARDKVMAKHEELINKVTDETELASTRAALADIFWMAVGALFVTRTDGNEHQDRRLK